MPLKIVVSIWVCALIFSDLWCPVQASEPAHMTPSLRLGSTSLCGDSYLLRLAPQEITALSWQSRDRLSTAPQTMQALPQIWDDAEVLIEVPIDLIVFGPGEGQDTAPYLAVSHQSSHTLSWGEDFKSVLENFDRLGAVMDLEARSETLIKEIEHRLSILQIKSEARSHRPSILYLSRSGGTAGANTYVDAAIQAAGGKNIITQAGWMTWDVEQIMALNPDIILTSFFEDGYESIQAKGVRHHTLRRFINARPQLDVPGKLWPCAGPGLIEVAERLSDFIDEWEAGQ